MRLTHRKRRIRKKWRIGEFTEYGFEVMGKPPTDHHAFCNQMIAWVEANGMTIGGPFSAESFEAIVEGYDYARKKRRSLGWKDIDAMAEMLKEAGATGVTFTGPRDVNRIHGQFVEELLTSLDAVIEACKNFEVALGVT